MSHPAQRKFCRSVKKMFPDFFKYVNVIDVGSLDINGNNKDLFRKSSYTGIDIVPGKNVDIVGYAHELLPKITPSLYRYYSRIETFSFAWWDVIISTEALEHDKYYDQTLLAMYQKLKSGGLMLITSAGDGRKEHGTVNNEAWASPGTNDYYQNISNAMFSKVLPPALFDIYHLAQVDTDLQFFGIKK